MPFEARDRASLRLVFSEAVSAGYRTLRDQAITATNGAVRQAQRIGGSSAEWNVTVEPSSREAVTVSVSGGTDTRGQGDSVCTDDGRRLSNSLSVTVEGPPSVPLTAELDNVPATHDGESTFTPSARPRRWASERCGTKRSSERRPRAEGTAPAVGQRPELEHHGTTGRARRRVHPAPGDRKLQREPRNLHDDGRLLSNALAATVMGPVAMTVAAARVEEAANAVVAFAVTLSRTATAQVTVDYTTRDGSPQAGSDYTAKSGTLTFQAGESSKTIEVAVLDDSHDEGEETFTLALERLGGVAPGRRGDRDDREHRPDAGGAPSAVRQSDRRAGRPARRGAHGSASRRAIMIRRPSGQGKRVPTWPPRRHAAEGVSLRCACCACCAGDGVAGYSTSTFSEDVEESDSSSAPVGYNVVYDVAVNL